MSYQHKAFGVKAYLTLVDRILEGENPKAGEFFLVREKNDYLENDWVPIEPAFLLGAASAKNEYAIAPVYIGEYATARAEILKPADGVNYYIPAFDDRYEVARWSERARDYARLESGLVFMNREDAASFSQGLRFLTEKLVTE